MSAGGLRPTFIYDQANDPNIRQWDYLGQAVANFLTGLAQRRREDRSESMAIFGSETSSMKQKGLTVDVEKYFNDASYRAQMKRDEASYDDIHRKSKAFSSESRGSLSPLIQSIGATTNLYPDKTPDFIMDSDLMSLRRILLEGEEDLNQLAITDLSAEEVAGIDGLEHELRRMGLWQEGETWHAADNVPGVREQLGKRFEWFEQGYKQENTNYVATESDAMAIVQRDIQTQSGRLQLVREFQVVKDMENADDNWITSQARLFKRNPDDETEIWDDDSRKYMDSGDFWDKYTNTELVYNKSIAELQDFKFKNPKEFESMMLRIGEERPDVHSSINSLIYTYEQGKNLISTVEAGIEPSSYMDLQSASLEKLEDLETAQHDIAPIAQELAYLHLVRAGGIKQDTVLPPTQLEGRINALEEKLTRYYNFRQEQYSTAEFSLRIDELIELFDNTKTQHMENLYQKPEEVHPDTRNQYINTVQDLDYQNVINSIDLLIQQGQ